MLLFSLFFESHCGLPLVPLSFMVMPQVKDDDTCEQQRTVAVEQHVGQVRHQ